MTNMTYIWLLLSLDIVLSFTVANFSHNKENSPSSEVIQGCVRVSFKNEQFRMLRLLKALFN